MKKIFLYLVLTLFVGQIAAQNRMVQGIERPDLQNKSTRAVHLLRTNTSFTLDSIDFWVGDGENRAALVISWHDGVTGLTDHLVWGYRWSANKEASGFQMIRDVALKDPRFIMLTQNTNSSTLDSLGYTIDGIGYSQTSRSDVKLKYVLGQKSPLILGASTDSRISFKFEKPYQMSTQIGHPATPQVDADASIVTGQSTGIITHPFNGGKYGYACYDYDYWQVDSSKYSSTPNVHWDAGWYNGYWSYYVRNSNKDDFGYSFDGATRRTLSDGCWDGWSYNGDMNNWEGTQPGEVLTAAPAVVKVNKKSATLNVGDELSLGLAVDAAYISGGNVIWTSANEDIAIIDNSSNTGATITIVGTGNTYVKATINGYSAFCDITVTGARKLTKVVPAAQATYTANGLFLKNLEGYTAYISSISGTVASTFKITSQEETKQLSLAPGIYTCTAVKGTEKVAVKFVVK